MLSLAVLLQKVTRIAFWQSPKPIRCFLWRYSHVLDKLPMYGELITYYDDSILIRCDLKNFIEKQLFFQGMQRGDLGVYFYIKKNLTKEKVFLDIGAAIGTFSLIAAKLAKKVIAFEPLSFHYNRLKQNIELNKFDNIETYQFALGDSCRDVEICIPDSVNTGMSHIVSKTSENNLMKSNIQSIKMITLDYFVKKYNVDRIDLIKMDVEGFELNILEGADKTIKKFKPEIIMEVNSSHLNRFGKKLENLFNLVHVYKYEMFLLQHDCKTYKLLPVNSTDKLFGHQNVLLKPYNQ